MTGLAAGSGIIRAGPLHATALSAIHARAFPEGEYWNEHIIAGQLSQPGVFGLLDPAGGMLLARLAADEAEILTLAVVPEHRQQGIGGRLLTRVALDVRHRGATRLFLEVSTRNPAARGLYQQLGFQQIGRRKAYYADGADALVLSKALAA